MSGYVVVEANQEAGAVVWWELHGTINAQALAAELDAQGIVNLMPSEPTKEVVVGRAVHASVATNHEVLSVGRGGWEVFRKERHLLDDVERITLHSVVVVHVRKSTGLKEVVYVATGPDGDGMAKSIASRIPLIEEQLYPEDVSSWLLDVAGGKLVGAVGLRNRGGFYFVPRDRLPFWNAITDGVRKVSAHTFFSLPAMLTEECAQAVLFNVRREAEAAFAEMEAYLKGEVSTKGLNAIERDVALAKEKVDRYVSLFEGETLSDLKERAVNLGGAAAALKLGK